MRIVRTQQHTLRTQSFIHNSIRSSSLCRNCLTFYISLSSFSSSKLLHFGLNQPTKIVPLFNALFTKSRENHGNVVCVVYTSFVVESKRKHKKNVSYSSLVHGSVNQIKIKMIFLGFGTFVYSLNRIKWKVFRLSVEWLMQQLIRTTQMNKMKDLLIVRLFDCKWPASPAIYFNSNSNVTFLLLQIATFPQSEQNHMIESMRTFNRSLTSNTQFSPIRRINRICIMDACRP